MRRRGNRRGLWRVAIPKPCPKGPGIGKETAMVMRNRVSTVVLVMALAVSQGLAQVDGPQGAAITASLPPGLEPVPPENWTAEMLLGAEVRDRAETPVAEVRDVQLTREGRLLGLLVEIGGLWGIGAKTVAVPFAGHGSAARGCRVRACAAGASGDQRRCAEGPARGGGLTAIKPEFRGPEGRGPEGRASAGSAGGYAGPRG